MSQAAIDLGIPEKLQLQRRCVAVRNCCSISKADLWHNTAIPQIDVAPDTYHVRVDGELVTCEPAEKLALTQLYFVV